MDATGERRFLSSPRFRRRLAKGGVLLAVVGTGALVSVLFWNTADPVVYPPSNRAAQVYVPELPVDYPAAEKRAVISVASRFLATAVKRDHSERAFAIVGPALRNGTTRRHWVEGDIPVVPYPVDDARWKFEYSYADEIGLQVLVFPTAAAAAALRPMIFNMSLKAVGSGAKRRWLVDSWTPRGGSGGTGRVRKDQGSPFALGASAESSATRLGAGWLVFPLLLLIVGALILPLGVIGFERYRSRQAQRAYEASRLAGR